MSYLNASRPNLARKKSSFLLCIFSLLAAILVCEMAYRGYLHFKKPLYRPSSYPHLGWEFTPGAEKTVRGREGGKITYFINHLGFRDKTDGEWEGWGPGDLKIAFIGDSVTIGAEVNYPDSYPALLQSAAEGVPVPNGASLRPFSPLPFRERVRVRVKPGTAYPSPPPSPQRGEGDLLLKAVPFVPVPIVDSSQQLGAGGGEAKGVPVLARSARAGGGEAPAKLRGGSAMLFGGKRGPLTFPEISRPVKTVNLGLEASNTLQHLSLLQHRALPLGPDIVILGYFMNDVEERFVEKLPRGVEFLLRHFYFGTFLSYRIATAVRNQSLRTPTAESPSECGAYATSVLGRYKTLAWSKTAALIRSMAERCREKGVRFGVVLFPFEPQVRGVCPVRAQKLMAEFCSQNDIPFLDLTEAYRSESSRQRLYPLGDEIHPNRAGHRVARDAIKKWLASDPYFSIS